MDHLWTPWRYAYVTTAGKQPSCIFCELPRLGDDQQARIVHRGRHLDELQKLSPDAAGEMMALTQKIEQTLRRLYNPDGINLGMNIGQAAGAGVAGHIHMHVLPRWVADANFMSVVGETRILPETLETTYQRIKGALKTENGETGPKN